MLYTKNNSLNKRPLFYFILFQVFILNGFNLQAQSPFEFEKTEHDFGEFYESAGEQSVTISYTNTGVHPLVISSANASCGCTTPTHNKDTVFPGQKGWVTAKYDPAGRPGYFDKHVFITFNNVPSLSANIRIRGTVISIIKPGRQTHAILYGSLSLTQTNFELGDLIKEGEYTSTIRIANDGVNDVKILGIQELPKFFTVDYPSMLKPSDSTTLTVKVNKKDLVSVWGDFTYRLVLITSDPLMPTKVLFVKGKLKQDFSGLTKKELAVAPVIKASSVNVDFGTIKKGGKEVRTIQIENRGKTTLEIRKIHASCFCLSGVSDKKLLEPGEKATVTFTFDTIGQREGVLNRGISIYTNDPKNSELVVSGTVIVQ
jgi:hypothetical protein